MFHGMLISPSPAFACIQALNGRILFLPSHYKTYPLDSFEVSNLTAIKYYALVLLSLTGLSTLLGLTTFIDQTENVSGISCAEISGSIKSYLAPDDPTLKVIRRFQYDFMLPGVKVKMFHLRGKDKRIHLVEIYENNFNLYLFYGVALVVSIILFLSPLVSTQPRHSLWA
eukprot:gb/GEZN01017360.1/.p1 GENE.gb/GEZN01017360.1/~~gb/GEZN01017360.1/.p1  ORF type:complete len:178 (-),score=14.77 gb/GEZN01017360.1/:267-776(-)